MVETDHPYDVVGRLSRANGAPTGGYPTHREKHPLWVPSVEKDLIDPRKTALLFVDPYNDFLSEGGKVWPLIKPIADEATCEATCETTRARSRARFALLACRWSSSRADVGSLATTNAGVIPARRSPC